MPISVPVCLEASLHHFEKRTHPGFPVQNFYSIFGSFQLQPLDHFLSKNTFFDLTTVSGAMCVFLDFGNEEKSNKKASILSLVWEHGTFSGDKILPTANKFFGWPGPGSYWKFTHLSGPPNNDQRFPPLKNGAPFGIETNLTFLGSVLQEGADFC